MELDSGRLRATLIAGKIELTEEACSTLIAGLNGIAYGYRIERVVDSEIKTDAELGKELSQLHRSSRTAFSILKADMSGLGQIEVLLSDARVGKGFHEFLEQLRSLSSRIRVLTMLDQSTAIRRRRQDPETWFLLAVYDLFAILTRDAEPGIAGPLHRFTIRCAAIVDERIEVHKSKNSFRKRLRAALDRRTGKIGVIPWPVFPGKNSAYNLTLFFPSIYCAPSARRLDLSAPDATFRLGVKGGAISDPCVGTFSPSIEPWPGPARSRSPADCWRQAGKQSHILSSTGN